MTTWLQPANIAKYIITPRVQTKTWFSSLLLPTIPTRSLHLRPQGTPNPSSVKIQLMNQQSIVPFIHQSIDVEPSLLHQVHHPVLQRMCQAFFQNKNITMYT